MDAAAMIVVFAILIALAVVSIGTAVLMTSWAVEWLLDSTVRRWREERELEAIRKHALMLKRPKRDLRQLPH